MHYLRITDLRAQANKTQTDMKLKLTVYVANRREDGHISVTTTLQLAHLLAVSVNSCAVRS
jgi:hypothetical protein